MDITILSAAQVREALAPLRLKQLEHLAALSGVPLPTIYKIRLGVTPNPGIETVRKFLPYVALAQASEVERREAATNVTP